MRALELAASGKAMLADRQHYRIHLKENPDLACLSAFMLTFGVSTPPSAATKPSSVVNDINPSRTTKTPPNAVHNAAASQ